MEVETVHAPFIREVQSGQPDIEWYSSSIGSRPYKSKRKRPCDLCRKRKSACRIETSPPCASCRHLGQQCTFIYGPASRRRNSYYSERQQDSILERNEARNITSTEGYLSSGFRQNALHLWEEEDIQRSVETLDSALGGCFPETLDLESPSNSNRVLLQTNLSSNSSDSSDLVNMLNSAEQCSGEDFTDTNQTTVSETGHSSLDRYKEHSTQLFGLTGESDPYLLNRYNYNDKDEWPLIMLLLRKMQGPEEASFPVQMMMVKESLGRKLMTATSIGEPRPHSILTNMVHSEVEGKLINLFFRFVHPYFPILDEKWTKDLADRKKLHCISVCLLSAIYASALPFATYLDNLYMSFYDLPHSEEQLWKLCWEEIQRELHVPRLAVLQACLLLLERKFRFDLIADSPFRWSLLGTTVSLAQTLGLHIDPTDWKIPDWEKRMRKRLFWATFVQDKWIALTMGRPSHLKREDFNIPVPEADNMNIPAEPDENTVYFSYLVRLTVIVDDILRTFYSLSSVGAISKDFHLSIQKAEPLRRALIHWRATLPSSLSITADDSSNLELNPHGSLHLAYYTAEITIFRALLRPLDNDGMVEVDNQKRPLAEAVQACRMGALSCGNAVLNFVLQLSWRHFRSFWHSWSRLNFGIASNYIVLLFVSSSDISECRQCKKLLYRWRSILQAQSESFDMMRLGMLRINTVFWQRMERMVKLNPVAEAVYRESDDEEVQS